MARREVLFVVGFFLFASAGAWAGGNSGGNLDAKVRAAKKACLSGDTKKGTELLADLYLDTNDANHIYNQGRCFEQNGQKEQAIPRFEEYLRKQKNLSADEVEVVRKRIESLQAAVDHRGKSAQPEPAAAPTPVPVPLSPVPAASTIPPTAAPTNTAEPLGILQTAPTPEPQETAPVYKRWWFWTGIGAVVAGGVVTAVVLSSKSAPKSPSCTPGVPCALP
jgi:hypothetical protein